MDEKEAYAVVAAACPEPVEGVSAALLAHTGGTPVTTEDSRAATTLTAAALDGASRLHVL